jgi:outer membrane receptor for Fe3+-dicitrate
MKMKLLFATILCQHSFTDKIFYHRTTLLQNCHRFKSKKQSRNVCLRSKTTLFSVKKNEVVRLSSINGNFATNNAREIFSRIPGVNIWENEGSGIQINVGVRGLSPNRVGN